MYKSGRWPIALPCYDDADAAGAGAPVVADVADAEGSLSDHEAEFVQSAPSEPTADDEPAPAASAAERDETGKFTKPRHRAASQRADADDVPAINELTKRLKAAEETHGKDIVRKDGESERVYNLRRRAELVERLATPPSATAARREEPAREPAPKSVAATPEARFPEFDVWLADPKNKDKDYNDYTDARADHRYDQRRATERAEEAERTETQQAHDRNRVYAEQVPAARAKYPDYDAVMATVGADAVSIVVERAAKAIGPEAAYYLASHPEELEALTGETLVLPTEPGFAAAVAATKRYLTTLVAPQRPTSTRTAAETTRAARATPPIAPKPPTLVRMGASRDAEDLPGDDSSLDEHERAFVKKRRA